VHLDERSTCMDLVIIPLRRKIRLFAAIAASWEVSVLIHRHPCVPPLGPSARDAAISNGYPSTWPNLHPRSSTYSLVTDHFIQKNAVPSGAVISFLSSFDSSTSTRTLPFVKTSPSQRSRHESGEWQNWWYPSIPTGSPL